MNGARLRQYVCIGFEKMLLMARKSKESAGRVETVPISYKLKTLAKNHRFSVTELYDHIKAYIVDPKDGAPLSFEAFRSRFNRGNEPKWLVDAAEQALLGTQSFGMRLTSKGVGRLRVIGGIGAGGDPSNYMDELELDVPIEFMNPDWCGMVVESDARSMMPYVQPGDVVVIKPARMEMVNKFMVVQSTSDPRTLYVKKVVYRNGAFELISTNPDTPPLDMKGLAIVGLVIGLISADTVVKIGPYEPGLSEEYMVSQLSSRLP